MVVVVEVGDDVVVVSKIGRPSDPISAPDPCWRSLRRSDHTQSRRQWRPRPRGVCVSSDLHSSMSATRPCRSAALRSDARGDERWASTGNPVLLPSSRLPELSLPPPSADIPFGRAARGRGGAVRARLSMLARTSAPGTRGYGAATLDGGQTARAVGRRQRPFGAGDADVPVARKLRRPRTASSG